MGTIAECLAKSKLDANTARYLKRQAKKMGDPIAAVRAYAAVVDKNIATLSAAVKQLRESAATHKSALMDAISAGRPVSADAADQYGVNPNGWASAEGRYIPPEDSKANQSEFDGRISEIDRELASLQKQYEKKSMLTGKALSGAIRKDGYDGIVTVEPSKGPNRPAHTAEIVDLTQFAPKLKPPADEPIPEFTRTTPDKGSATRKYQTERVEKAIGEIADLERKRRVKRGEYDKLRSNATKKRAAVKKEIAAIDSRIKVVESEIAADRASDTTAKLEDELESPRSYDHYLAGMKAIHRLKAGVAEDAARRNEFGGERARADVSKEERQADRFDAELQGRAKEIAKSQGFDSGDAEQIALSVSNVFTVFEDRSLADVVEVQWKRTRESRVSQEINKLKPDSSYNRQQDLSNEQIEAFTKQYQEASLDDKSWLAKRGDVDKAVKEAIKANREVVRQQEDVDRNKKEVENAKKAQEVFANARERAKKYFLNERISKALKKKKPKTTPVKIRQESVGGPVKVVDGKTIDGDQNGELYTNGLILHKSFEEGSKDFTLTHAHSGLAFPFSAKKSALQELISLLDILGVDFNIDTDADGRLPSELVSRVKKINTAWDIGDYATLSDQDYAIVEALAEVPKTDIEADLILTADDLGVNGIPPGLASVMSDRGVNVIKEMAIAVPEFSYDPVFTVQDGKLVYRDGYVFKLEPQAFNLHPSELKEGQTVGINLEDMGIKRNTPQDVVSGMLKHDGFSNISRLKGGDITASVRGKKVNVIKGEQDNDWDVVGGSRDIQDLVIATLKKIRWRQPGQTGDPTTDINQGETGSTEDDPAKQTAEEKKLSDKIKDIPDVLYQTDNVDESIRVQALDIAFAAEDAGIKTFDQLVAYSVKTVGERRTREIGWYLTIAANGVGFPGVRPVGDVLGTPNVTKEQAVSFAKAAFPMLSDEKIEAGIDIVDRLGLLDKIGFAPDGSPVPQDGLTQDSIHLSIVPDKALLNTFLETGAASAYRVHDGDLPLPEKSKNEWSDSSEFMPGVSGYASLSSAVDDILFGAIESVTGENYASRAKNPTLVVMHGKQLDAPGAEFVIPRPKISAVLTKSDLDAAMRQTLPANDQSLSIVDILEKYEFDDNDMEQIAIQAAKNKYESQGQALFQNQTRNGNVKGWTSFITATRAIIGATDKADVSTFIHEIAHPIRRFLLNREVPQNKRADITDDEILSLENVLGVEDGVWEVEHEEKFAKMWEQYWFEGKAPVKGLESLFKKIAKWMHGVYQSIQQITGVQLPVEVRDLFDKLVQRSDGEFRDMMSQNEIRDMMSRKQLPETTSIKNENVNANRADRGVGSLADVATQTKQEWLDAADELLQDDPMLGDRLVKELNHNARNLSNVEVAVMQIYYRQMNNRLEKVSDRLFQAKDAKDAAASAKALLDVDMVMNTLVEMEEATKKAGREWGRAGVARQIELEKDFSLAAILRKARIANGGNALSAEQLADMDALARKVADLEGKLAKAVQEKLDLERRKNTEAQIEDSKTNGQPVPESIRKKVVDKLNAFRSKFASAFASSSKTDSLFATEDEQMADEAKSVIQEYVDIGISTIGELLSNLRKDLGSDIPVSVQAAFTTAWKDMHDNGYIPVPMVDKNDVRGLSRLAKQIERSLVEAGITKLEDVVKGVRESLLEIIPDITERETMDALSGYGQYSPPSDNQDDKIISDINGRLLELAKLDDMENKIAPARTGKGRQELSDEHRELIRKVNAAKRDGNYRVTDPDTQLKSAVSSARTALVNRISDLNKALRVTHQPIISSAKIDLAGQNDEIIALRKERDELMKEYKATFPKPEATMEQRIAATTRVLDRVIADLEKQLKTGDFSAKKNSEPISTKELDAKRARIDALRAQRDSIIGLKERTEEQKAKAYKANLLKQIADYQDRSLHSFFGPKPKKEARTLSPEEIALKLELQKTKDEFFLLAGLYRLQHMSPRERAWDYVKETAHLSRALMTSFDFSAVFRQGGTAAFAHPMIAAETSKEMYKAMRSEAANFDTAEKIRMDDIYQFAMTAGLQITEDEGKITKQEEAYMGRWARLGLGTPGSTLNTISKGLLTPVSASARGYMTFLNGIRFKLFKHMVANLGKGGQVTADEAKVIAFFINAATGRSELGPMMKWAEQANMLFFAPRFVASRFQYLGMPLWLLGSKKVSGRVKKAIAMEYIRHSAGVMSFLALTVALGALLAGDDEDEKPTVSLDPRSSDFLKIKWGETRIDPMSGLSQVITLMGRIAFGQRVGDDGKVVNLRGEDVPYGGLGMAGTVGNFVRTKFAPVPGAAFDIASGENVVRQPVTPFSSIINLFIPLSLREINDTAQSRGIPQTSLIALLSLHGMGSSTYGPESNYRKATPEDREKQFVKDLKKMTFDSRDPPYKKMLSKEQTVKVDERREDRKQGLVFEASSNPIRKAYKNDETYNKAVKERDVALEQIKKSGLTLDESRKLLIKHWESQYGSAKEKGSLVYKPALSDRLRQLRKEFAQ